MTNEELKKKIVEVLEETEYEWTEEKNGYVLQIFYDKLAAALIAAGLGDVKELQLDKKAYEAASNHYRILFEEAQCRTEVAEKALKTACVNIVTDEEDDIAIEPRANVLYKAYLRNAEKELAEEGEDDSRGNDEGE